jgi:hypothetical protein
MKSIIALLAVVGTLSACAQQPGQIAAAPVTQGAHDRLSCKQIASELYVTQSRLGQLSAAQQAEANKDAAWVAGGALLFFPAMIVAAAGEDHAADIAKLKGDEQSLMSSKIRKGC